MYTSQREECVHVQRKERHTINNTMPARKERGARGDARAAGVGRAALPITAVFNGDLFQSLGALGRRVGLRLPQRGGGGGSGRVRFW